MTYIIHHTFIHLETVRVDEDPNLVERTLLKPKTKLKAFAKKFIWPRCAIALALPPLPITPQCRFSLQRKQTEYGQKVRTQKHSKFWFPTRSAKGADYDFPSLGANKGSTAALLRH